MAAAWRRGRLRSENDEETHGLPEIPRATMTGMSTFIREEGEEITRNESRVSSLNSEAIMTESITNI